MLVTNNIIKNRKDKSYIIFTTQITNNYLADTSLPLRMEPSNYVKECWNRYEAYRSTLSKKKRDGMNSINGKIFELIIATALHRKKIVPFYQQASFYHVPDVDYDIIMYDKNNKIPITISIKTSSRERYKQAALEAYALKTVYRSAINYLVVNNLNDSITIQKKIDNRQILGLDKAILATSSDFDDLINDLKKRKLGLPPKVELFEGEKIK